MKKIIYFLSAILVAGFASCDGGSPESPITPVEPDPEDPVTVEIQGTAIFSPFKGLTAADDVAVTWKNNDNFRLYDMVLDGEIEEINSTKMTVATGATASAGFTGMVNNVKEGRSFYAVYPYVSSTTTSDLTKYPVSIAAAQNDGDSGSHIIGIASAASFTGNPDTDKGNPLSLQFKLVNSMVDVAITNGEGRSVKSVKIAADGSGMPFTTAGTVSLKSATSIAVAPTTYAAAVETSFATAKTDASISAHIFLLPVTVTDDLKIVVTLSDEMVLTFPVEDFDGVFTPGKISTIEIDLSDVEVEEPEPENPYAEFFNITPEGVVTAYNGPVGVDIELTFPPAATSILDMTGNAGVFYEKTFKSIDLNKVTVVGKNAFKLTKVDTVNAPEVVTIMEEGFNSSTLKSISCPKLTTLYSYAFQTCTNLETVDLANVTTLEAGARVFRQCTALKSVSMPLLTSPLGTEMFIECTALESVSMKELTAIGGSYVFKECTSLTDVDMPKVRSLALQTFIRCISLVEIYLPKLEFVGPPAVGMGQCFANCDALESVNFPKATTLRQRCINAPTIKTLYFPEVTAVDNEGLSDMASVERITLPKVTSLGSNILRQNSSNFLAVLDLSQATGLETVAADVFHATNGPDGLTVYVATQAIKDLFTGTYKNVTIVVGPAPAP